MHKQNKVGLILFLVSLGDFFFVLSEISKTGGVLRNPFDIAVAVGDLFTTIVAMFLFLTRPGEAIA